MHSQLQRIEIERPAAGHDDLAVADTLLRQAGFQWLEQLRKVSIERLLIAALQQELVAVAKQQSSKAVPLRFEDPSAALGQRAHSLGQHRLQGWRYGESHRQSISP